MKFIIDTRDFHLFLFFTFVLLRLQTQNFILLENYSILCESCLWKYWHPQKEENLKDFSTSAKHITHTQSEIRVKFFLIVKVKWVIIKNCLLVISFQLRLWTDCLWWLKTGRRNLQHRLQKRFWSYPLHSDDFKTRNKTVENQCSCFFTDK